MATINLLLAAANLGVALLTTVLAVPLLRGRVPMNHLYGVRFRRSFESDALWYRINRYGARRAIVWSVVLAVVGIACLFLPLENADGWVIALSSTPLIYVIPAWESYRYSQRA